jgi:membrane-associated phospholipid phosphatase
MRRRTGLAVWLVTLAAAEVIAFWVVWRVFVRSEHGQLLDSLALAGNRIGRARIHDRADVVLNTISVVSLAAATAVVGFIALVRRQIALAVGAILLVAGANVTAQFAKQILTRPDFGVDPELAAVGNSLPSGHTTVAASVVVALVLVLPARLRGVAGVLGAMAAAGIGVGTLSAGWHRPSDAVAALLVVGAWACAASLFIIAAQRRDEAAEPGPSHGYAVVALTVAGVMLLGGAALAMVLTNHVRTVPAADLTRSRLFAAYAGGAMGISGTAALVIASVLATVHRVSPGPRPVQRSAGPAASLTGAE